MASYWLGKLLTCVRRALRAGLALPMIWSRVIIFCRTVGLLYAVYRSFKTLQRAGASGRGASPAHHPEAARMLMLWYGHGAHAQPTTNSKICHFSGLLLASTPCLSSTVRS